MELGLFLSLLKQKLSGLPRKDVERWCAFYEEAVADRVEEGLTEAEAIAEIGSTDEIANEILKQTPLSLIVKERIKPKSRMSAGSVLLIALGSPIWLSLLIAFGAVLLSIYIVMWALVAVCYACDLTFAAGSLAGMAYTGYYAFEGQPAIAIAFLGAAILLSGLGILGFMGSNRALIGMIKLTKMIPMWIKKMFVRGGKRNDCN